MYVTGNVRTYQLPYMPNINPNNPPTHPAIGYTYEGRADEKLNKYDMRRATKADVEATNGR